MEFSILGPLQASEDGRPVSLPGGKPRALLALLLLNAGTAVSTDRLIDSLWGESPPETAAEVLQTCVSQLRKSVGAALQTRPGAYVLNVEPDALDLARFERLAAEGRRELREGRPEAAAACLRVALALWRGPALAEFRNEPFAAPEARRLEEARIVTLEDRIEADLAAGGGAGLVPELEALVAEHPDRERLRDLLMHALDPSLDAPGPALPAARQRRGARVTAAVVICVIAAGVALALALTVR